MSYVVSGTIAAEPYRVGIHAQPPDDDTALGVAMGSTTILTAIEAHEGLDFSATPTSEPLTLSRDDGDSIYAFLLSQTKVDLVTGAAPDLVPEDAAGFSVVH